LPSVPRTGRESDSGRRKAEPAHEPPQEYILVLELADRLDGGAIEQHEIGTAGLDADVAEATLHLTYLTARASVPADSHGVPCSITSWSRRAPLFGHNLVRLLYLDDAGTDQHAPFLCVAGVMIHGDYEWPEVERRIVALIDKYIPESDQLGFVFHATDIFHGSGYFDRRKPEWADEGRRENLLNEMANIIDELSLPVVFATYDKSKFGTGSMPLPPFKSHQKKAELIHHFALIDCLIRGDMWLEKFAATELATVVHEDGVSAKLLIKLSVRWARNSQHLESKGLTEAGKVIGLPLRRIIDTVHFAEKGDARPLQLADLCAFILNRGLKDKPVPEVATTIVFKHLKWISEIQSEAHVC
jgi:hypothetical protein